MSWTGWMCEPEEARVQSLTLKCSNPGAGWSTKSDRASGARAVEPITDQRVAAMSEMDTDLMGSAGGEAALDERRLRAERAFDPIARDRGFSPALSDDCHLLAVCRAAANIADDLSGGWGRHAPYQRGIGTLDPAQGKVARQRMMGRLRLGDDHQPAGVLVKTMDNTRPTHAADPRKIRAAMSNQGVHQCAVRVSRGRMDNHAGRLVEDDQMGILEADIERQGLRDRRWILILGEEYYEVLAAADAHSRIALRLPLAHDVTGLDQPFQSCARQGRQMVCERAIEAQAGL